MSSASLMQSSMQSLLLRFSSVAELPGDYDVGAAVAVDLSLVEQMPQFAEFVGGALILLETAPRGSVLSTSRAVLLACFNGQGQWILRAFRLSVWAEARTVTTRP